MECGRGWLSVLALAVTGNTAIARAEPDRDVALQVDAPAETACITAARLASEVEERVGSLVFLDAQAAERTLHVRVSARPGGGYRASIRLQSVDGRDLGERALQSEPGPCEDLRRLLVLVISTLIGVEDPAAANPPGPEPQRSAASPLDATGEPEPDARAPAPVVSVPAIDPTATAPAPSDPWRIQWTLLAEAHGGLLPGITPLASVALGGRRGWFAFRAGTAVAPWARRDLGDGADVRFLGWFGLSELCAVTDVSGLSAGGDVGVCAGALAGGLQATTEGLADNASSLRAVVRLDLRATLALPIAPGHALVVGLGGGVPVLGQRYRVLETGRELRTVHVVEPSVFVQIGWRIQWPTAAAIAALGALDGRARRRPGPNPWAAHGADHNRGVPCSTHLRGFDP